MCIAPPPSPPSSLCRYALAAAALEQVHFASAMLYKAVVLEVAANAVAERKSPLLGVLYDEVARCVPSVSSPAQASCAECAAAGASGRTWPASWAMHLRSKAKWQECPRRCSVVHATSMMLFSQRRRSRQGIAHRFLAVGWRIVRIRLGGTLFRSPHLQRVAPRSMVSIHCWLLCFPPLGRCWCAVRRTHCRQQEGGREGPAGHIQEAEAKEREHGEVL